MIRKMRLKRGITLEQLSKISGISRVSINRYELGERCPNVQVAKRLADALDCTIEELMDGSQDDNDTEKAV